MEADNKTYSYDQVYDAAIKYFKGDEMAASTWIKKYCLINKEGEYLETSPDDMHKRMALAFSKQEEKYNHDTNQDLKLKLSEYGYNRAELTKEDIYNLFKDFKYVIPAGSVMAGLGSEIPVSLSNCWVISGPEDTLEDIFRVCNEQSQLMKRRGGVGFDISKLRPAGSLVNNSAKMSTGSASFMELFSNVTSTISQCGRRGALMLSINMLHPDALEFIEKKQDLTKVTGANVSVQIDDDFMYAVMNDLEYVQQWPIDVVINKEKTNELNGTKEYEYGKLYPMLYTENEHSSKLKNGYMKVVKAKELWDKLIHCAWNTAEPGIIFSSRHHNFSPDGVYPSFKGTCTNPCVVGDTIVKTNKGEMKITDLIESLKDSSEIKVLTMNEETKTLEYKEVDDGFLTKKNANVIEIETEDGGILKLTPDHKVYTENRGWVCAADLTDSDVLLVT